jgi:hypothetical protein
MAMDIVPGIDGFVWPFLREPTSASWLPTDAAGPSQPDLQGLCRTSLRGLTSPRLLREWLFKGPINRIEHIERDLVVGGSFFILEDADRRKIDHFGEYTEIVSPRLAFWLEVPVHFTGSADIGISLLPTSEGSEMDFLQPGNSPSVVEKSWRTMFTQSGDLMLRTGPSRE